MGDDLEKIWRYKYDSQELERKGEINLPKECLKGFVIRRAIVNIGRLTACFFLFRGHGLKEKEHWQFKDVLAKQFLLKALAYHRFGIPALSC